VNHTYQKNKILCVLQVRGGSKGVPRKNIRKVNGKPLMTWTIESAKKSNVFDSIWVSSDSDEILEVGRQEEVNTIKRPEELSGDEVLSVDSLHWVVGEIEKLKETTYDYVVELPVVCPLRNEDHIREAVNKLITTDADSVISVTQMTDKHPVRMKRITDDDLIEDFCSEYPEGDAGRRQDLEPCYIRNGGIYSMKRDTLINEKTRHGKVSRPYVMEDKYSINIDSEIDLRIAEVMLND
jgi:D-3-phosphoglycerate dehydrogenase / 2-oxoglutarate reductase